MFSNDLKGFFDLAFFSFLVCSDGYWNLADHTGGNYSMF
jgi:hypothetical protein